MVDLAAQTLATLTARAMASELTPQECMALAQDPRRGARRLAAALQQQAQAHEVELRRLRQMSWHERQLWDRGLQAVAGVDEVGVGPLAGPVVAAAVVLPPALCIAGIDDSKKLSAKQRARLDGEIRARCTAWGIGMCSAAEIDARNIFVATREAARRAVMSLPCAPEHVLVDAHRVPNLNVPQTPLVRGDSLSQSIAAASIVAKVARDALMGALDMRYPGYGFAQHVGYGTAQHLEALGRLGACPEHRRSFRPVAEVV